MAYLQLFTERIDIRCESIVIATVCKFAMHEWIIYRNKFG